MPVRASGSQPCSVPTPMRSTAIISTWISRSGAINRIIADDRTHWQRKHVRLFRRINARNSAPIGGLPPGFRHFQRQYRPFAAGRDLRPCSDRRNEAIGGEQLTDIGFPMETGPNDVLTKT